MQGQAPNSSKEASRARSAVIESSSLHGGASQYERAEPQPVIDTVRMSGRRRA